MSDSLIESPQPPVETGEALKTETLHSIKALPPAAKVVMSGMRPTGKLHLGHYMGVLRNWVSLQNEYPCFFMVADWHALTTKYDDTDNLRANIMDMPGFITKAPSPINTHTGSFGAPMLEPEQYASPIWTNPNS